MNFHELLDLASLTFSTWAAGGRRYFARSTEGPGFREYIPRITLDLPSFEGEGDWDVDAFAPPRVVDPAFRVYRWSNPDCPTLIWHHGLREHPFDFGRRAKNTFRHIFPPGRIPSDLNIILVRAPWHRGTLEEYLQTVSTVMGFSGMIAASVRLVEALLSRLRELGAGPVIVSGISLGGWVTNLHRAYMNTADAYIPLLAGAALGDLFLMSDYRRLTAGHALLLPGRIRRALNFEEDFRKVAAPNLYPLLARYDRFIIFDRQSPVYEGYPLRVLEKGHITAALSPALLREHILEHVPGWVPESSRTRVDWAGGLPRS